MTKTVKDKLPLLSYLINHSDGIADQIGKQIVALFNLKHEDNHEGADRYQTSHGPQSTVDIAKKLLNAFERLDGHRGISTFSGIGSQIAHLFALQQPIYRGGKYITAQGLKTVVELEDSADSIILTATKGLADEVDNLLRNLKKKPVSEDLAHQILVVDVVQNGADNGVYFDGHLFLYAAPDTGDDKEVIEELAKRLSEFYDTEIQRTEIAPANNWNWHDIGQYLTKQGILNEPNEEKNPHDILVVYIAKHGSDTGIYFDGNLLLYADPNEGDDVGIIDELASRLNDFYCTSDIRRMKVVPTKSDWNWFEVGQVLSAQGLLHRTGGTNLNELQLQVAKHYKSGDFGHVKSTEDVNNIEDSLFQFLIAEAHKADGDLREYVNIVQRTDKQLRTLAVELQEELEQSIEQEEEEEEEEESVVLH